jgi:UDP-glucose 4-epimerase
LHLVSSAGGLFEGRTACTGADRPVPLRPYGEGKLAQEAALAGLPAEIGWRIYRPSSIYGHVAGGRAGLIPTLMINAMQGRTSRVFGGLSTLRDYVLADDVGRHIAGRVLADKAAAQPVEVLALARPATIFEIIRLVERAVGRGLNLQIDPHPSNARDISFLPAACPADWQPTPLSSGVRLVAQTLRTALWAGPA